MLARAAGGYPLGMTWPDPTVPLVRLPTLPLRDGLVWPLGLSLFALVLVADLLTPASLVVGTLLCGPVALAALGTSRRPILILTGLGVLGNLVAGAANVWQYEETQADLLNRTISILTVLLVGLLTSRARVASERAAQLRSEEHQLNRERTLRTLVEEMGGVSGQTEFVGRAASVLQQLTQAASVEIGALEHANLRQPHALAAGEAGVSGRLNQALPPELLAVQGSTLPGKDVFVARLHRPDAGDLLLLLTSPRTPKVLTRELVMALQPLLNQAALLDDLRYGQERLAQRGEVLRDLVYAFSHDLRTPLIANTMNMRAALKGGFGPLSAEYQATLQNGLEANEALLSLADQLLLVAKYESGEGTETEAEAVNLRELTLGIMADLESRAAERGVTLDPDLDGVSVPGRRHDLRRAIQNLLDNAVKFSPAGGTVTVTLLRQADEARLSVQDDGEGVSSERRAALFQRFRGGGAGRGTGLGLYLTRRIAEAHRGRVEYARTSKARSVFTLSLPMQALPEAPHA